MQVLDLCAGFGGWSSAFKERGHKVKTLDSDPIFECDLIMNILDLDVKKHLNGWVPDIVLASPPCNHFSVTTITNNWIGHKGFYIPKTKKAKESQEIVKKTLEIIKELDPSYWVLENPRGMLRKMRFMKGRWERATVTYCQYGEKWMKPTDLWGGFPPSLKLRKPCKNGDPCHESAPRGSKISGVQGVVGPDRAALRAMIPIELSLALCLAAEKDLEGNKRYEAPLTLDYFIK